MVQLKEVEDEHFANPQPGPAGSADNDDDFYTDTDSELSTASDGEDGSSLEETLAERLLALRDMMPPAQRAALASSASIAYRWAAAGLSFGGRGLWVLSTGAMMVGIPWALALAEDAQMAEAEREMRMQQGANEVLAPGAAQLGTPGGQPQAARPAL
ncbi:MAG: hypothetical protein M1832_004319 [Thelocarpon impressellum]|nr:MAG: hypothetical protein M1832_004319 [Thelocarpon impressellum]